MGKRREEPLPAAGKRWYLRVFSTGMALGDRVSWAAGGKTPGDKVLRQEGQAARTGAEEIRCGSSVQAPASSASS